MSLTVLKAMFESGFWTLGHFRGVPIRLHWSIALGAVFFSGFRFAPLFWLAFFGLILVHELGHAWIVQRLGHRALSVDVMGFGGMCTWDAHRATRLHEALVAWGGVGAQFLVLLAAVLLRLVLGAPSTAWQAELANVFINTNVWLMLLNLLPLPSLDGAKAWTLFAELKRGGFQLFGGNHRRPKPPRRSSRSTQPPKPRSHGAKPGEDDVSQNSAQARRELARVLERVAKEAGENHRRQ